MPSTVIRRFAYRPESRSLDVEFVTGRVYRYREVPEDIALVMRRSFSKGAFFNSRIRDHFAHQRLPRWTAEEAQPAASWDGG